jgi:hypothetical protein
MLICPGTLIYNPSNPNTKLKPWWLIVRVPHGVVLYYQDWVWRTERTKLTTSAWGAHLSVIRGERPPNKELWKQHANRKIKIEYDANPICNRMGHWWLPARCPDLNDIRKDLGLNPRPRVPFHITIGKAAY